MAPFYPVTICRSDGQLEVITKTGVKELNRPTAAQLNDSPDAEGTIDCYKKLEHDEPKAVDWRRKIGGMLMHYLGGREHADRNYILKDLPEGYVLWEHVKYNVEKLAEEKKKGKHAAGIFERQDAYLYGHPQGRKKRYRSPADFFPHVLWLATDKDGDPRNCSCKVCSPDGEEGPQEDNVKVEVVIPAKKEVKPAPMVSSIPQKASPAPPKPPPQSASPVRSAEQRLDGDPNSGYLYRPGELVWFNRGHAWGLAVISKRRLDNNVAQYLVQPLSHPLSHPPFQIKEQESIRPWLAWSVPTTTIHQIDNLTYEQVPWDRIIRGEFGSGDFQVDGSILAAKGIDGSYSLYDRIESPLVGSGEVHYNGMFLGAEKIWVGEPVRLRVPGDDIIVLVIQKLIERTVPPATSIVTFIGDIYKFVEMPMPYSNRSEWPTPSLPARMVTDLRFRNEVADNANKRTWYEWQLLEPAARRGLADIKGRWYETRTLLPVLRGVEQYQLGLQRGETSDAGLWMNGRGDTSRGPGVRKKNRKDTLGQAVPVDFKVSRGLDGPAQDDIFPDAGAAQQQPQAFVMSDIDQFMDLDGAAVQGGFSG
ncbi:hypothetical protein ACMFMG_005499 [Clarireedia jacksonii]